MSHQVETMFYVGAEPWHGLGKKLDTPPTSAEAIVAAGLDWDVAAEPVYMRSTAPGMDGFVDIPEAQVIRRHTDGSVLGVVGPQWTPVQNRDAFGFFDPLVQEGLATYHTAGSLRDGRIVWILAQIGETKTIAGDDGVGQFLLLSMGHGGGRAVQVAPTPIRVVCANTLSMADSGAVGMIRIPHRTNVVRRLDELRDFIRPYLTSFDTTMESFQLLASACLTPGKVEAYLDDLFPIPDEGPGTRTRNLRDAIIAKFEGGLLGYDALPPGLRQSYWTLYNSVTEYVDHERGRNGARMESAWFGTGAAFKRKALELALDGVKGR